MSHTGVLGAEEEGHVITADPCQPTADQSKKSKQEKQTSALPWIAFYITIYVLVLWDVNMIT